MPARDRRLAVWLCAVVLTGCGKSATDLGEVGDTGPATQEVAPEVLQTLLDRKVRLEQGLSGTVEFEVPADAYTLTIVVEGDGTYTLDSWEDPDGVSLVRTGWIEDEGDWLCRSCLQRVGWSEEAFSTVAPNGPEVPITAGTHRITIAGDWDERVGVTVLAKVADAPHEQGVLDLNLWFTGAYGWTAAVAEQDAHLAEVLDYVDMLYGKAGLSLGDHLYLDLDERWQNIESTWGNDNDMAELLRQSESAPRNALNVFFVDELYSAGVSDFGSGSLIIGVSGGTPGPVLVQGTSSSGVVVSTWSTLSVSESQRWAPALAGTVAHEVGHFLGLEHTTEYDGTPDGLPDTPDDDRSYLMHWDPDPTEGKFSEFQGQMLLQNPWVRHP